MEVEMFNSQLENSDTGDRDVNNIATLPSLNPSATKNQRNIHSGSFGSGSSSCSSASSASSLSTGVVTAYSSASTMRGHRDKYSSSGRALNTASNMNSVKKRNSNATDYIPSTNGHSDTAGYISENGPAENELGNDNCSIQTQSTEDYIQTTKGKLVVGRNGNRTNLNRRSDNAQNDAVQYQRSISLRSKQNGSNSEQISNDLQSPNNYPHSPSPGSNSGRLYFS